MSDLFRRRRLWLQGQDRTGARPFGADGTALPITYELSKCQPRQVVIVNRTVSKAKVIAELIGSMADARAVGETELGDELADSDLVVNTANSLPP